MFIPFFILIVDRIPRWDQHVAKVSVATMKLLVLLDAFTRG